MFRSILLIGDPHFQLANQLETDEMTRHIVELIHHHRPSLTVVLGDVLHTHDKINVNPLVRAIKFLEEIRDASEHLLLLIGNHDRPTNTAFLTEDHPFTALKVWPRTTVVDRVVTHVIPGEHPLRCLAVPYVPTGRLEEALRTEALSLEDTSLDQFDVVFLHQEVKGAKMGALVSDHGDTWPATAPMAFSGHIHDYQVIAPNFIYPGTPIQHGFADKPDKGVMLTTWCFQEGGWRLQHQERIRLRVPPKVHLRVTAEQLPTLVLEPGTTYKVTLVGNPVELRKLLELPDVQRRLQGARYTIADTRVSRDLPREPETSISFSQRFRRALEGEGPEVRALAGTLFR